MAVHFENLPGILYETFFGDEDLTHQSLDGPGWGRVELKDLLGAGTDEREAEERDVYHLGLDIDLGDDLFAIRHDTGNLGLATGIMMDMLSKIRSGHVK